jgi:hypothetical protein
MRMPATPPCLELLVEPCYTGSEACNESGHTQKKISHSSRPLVNSDTDGHCE